MKKLSKPEIAEYLKQFKNELLYGSYDWTFVWEMYDRIPKRLLIKIDGENYLVQKKSYKFMIKTIINEMKNDFWYYVAKNEDSFNTVRDSINHVCIDFNPIDEKKVEELCNYAVAKVINGKFPIFDDLTLTNKIKKDYLKEYLKNFPYYSSFLCDISSESEKKFRKEYCEEIKRNDIYTSTKEVINTIIKIMLNDFDDYVDTETEESLIKIFKVANGMPKDFSSIDAERFENMVKTVFDEYWADFYSSN